MNINFSTKTDANADKDSKSKPSALKFSFDFKKSKDGGNESSQTQSSGFIFSPQKSNNGDDSKPKFNFGFNKKTDDSTKEKSDKEGNDSAKPKGIQFNFSKNKKGDGKFTFGVKNKSSTLTFNFGTGKDFQAEKKEFSSKNFDFKNSSSKFSPKISPSASQSKDGEENETVEENGFCASEKTGEEDEEILLNIPSKLFIFEKPEEPKDSDPKAKKEQPKPGYAERGTGTLHFNYNKENNYYRMIFRRKPIETLVLNQRIFTGMTPRKQGTNSIQFLGQIIAPKKFEKDEAKNKETNENKLDILLLKCKDEESANKLLALIQKAISESK